MDGIVIGDKRIGIKQEVTSLPYHSLRGEEGQCRCRWVLKFDNRKLRKLLLKTSIFSTERETEP